MIDWEAHQAALKKKNKGKTRAEQLAGDDLAFWANFHELHGQKFKDLCESVILDLRYGNRYDVTSDILVREGIEALQRAINACSVEVNNARKPKKDEEKKFNRLKI